MCSYEDTVSVKFDDGPIFQYPCKSDPDGKSERILIMPDYTSPEEQPSNPIDGIIKAKVMTVEAKFYEYGARQILFNVAGLDEAKI